MHQIKAHLLLFEHILQTQFMFLRHVTGFVQIMGHIWLTTRLLLFVTRLKLYILFRHIPLKLITLFHANIPCGNTYHVIVSFNIAVTLLDYKLISRISNNCCPPQTLTQCFLMNVQILLTILFCIYINMCKTKLSH